MKDYEVFKQWLGDVMDVIYGPSHNWPFKALEKEGMLMGKIKQKQQSIEIILPIGKKE